MSRLSIRLLGTFGVTLEGEPATAFESDKARALLAYLAVESGRAHPREKLAGMLWPERREQVARAYLRRLLVNLRRVIGDYEADPPPLCITRQTIQFSMESDVWIDVTAFLTRVHSRESTDPQTIHHLEEAVKLWRGGFLEGFSLAGSPAFEEWMLLKGEHYRRLLMDALGRLTECYERRGEYEPALRHAWRQVEQDPWREEAHLQVMRLLALDGQRGASLAQYERCRQLLRDEFGAEPSAETTEFYESIRDGGSVEGSSVQSDAQPVPTLKSSVPLYDLPSQSTPFVGRKEELAALEDLLTDETVRLVTITGPGGIGKTRLALAAGAMLAEKQAATAPNRAGPMFPHGVVFVTLVASRSTDELVPAMAEALQLRLDRGQGQLFDYLRNKQLLLIVDNMEHLLDGVGLLAEILRPAPGVKLLVTSRERLQLHGEQIFPVQGLAFPEQEPTPAALASIDVDAYIRACPAVELFVGSARRVQPALVPGLDDLTTLVQICRMVEGMPLALELAASWAGALSLDDILVEIQQSLDFLEADSRDILRRQRSVRAVFDTSWNQLGPAEQVLFPQLSVFRGGFTRSSTEKVAEGGMGTTTSARMLSRLVNRSFIQYDQTHNRYQMHELLRQYGAEKLAQDPVHHAGVQDRHSRCFCRWMCEQEASLKSVKQQAALLEIEIEIENIRTACNWAASQGQAERLNDTIGALGLFYDWRKSYLVGESVLEKLAESLSGFHDPPSSMTAIAHRVMARVLGWQGRFNGMLGNAERVVQLAQQSLVHLDSPQLAGHDTRLERAHVWLLLAYVQLDADAEAAKGLFVGSRDLYREVGESCEQAHALIGLGRASRTLHADEDAEDSINQSLALQQAMGDQIGSVESLALLSDIALRQGQFVKAERLIRQSLTVAQNPSGVLAWAYTLICTGRFVEAKAPAEESAALYMDLGMREWAFWACQNLSLINLHLSDYHLARIHAEEALSLARSVDSDRKIGIALGQMAAVALVERAYDLAKELCEESLAIWQEVLEHPSPRDLLGLAARGLGHHDRSKEHFLAQLQWAVEHQRFFPLVFTLSGIALLLADEGQQEPAVEIYALVVRYPFVANSRWFEEVAGRELEAVAAQLPLQTMVVARARGQAADLWQAAAEWLRYLTT